MTISYSVPETRSSNVTFGTVTSFVSSKPALSLIVTTHFSGASPSYYSESDSRSLMTTECPEKLTLFGSVPAVS